MVLRTANWIPIMGVTDKRRGPRARYSDQTPSSLTTVNKQSIIPLYNGRPPVIPAAAAPCCVTILVLMVSTGIMTQQAAAAAAEPINKFSTAEPARPMTVMNRLLSCWKNVQVSA